MKWIVSLTISVLIVLTAAAQDKFPTLKVGTETYTNVTVTTVTATDIYFSHSRGMGNAKLKLLPPELQKRFNFDAVKGAAEEKAQAEATASFLRHAATNRLPVIKPGNGREDIAPPREDEKGELVASRLYAASFRGQQSPRIVMAQWLTPAPDLTNKFLLVDFFVTSAEPVHEAVPHLNDIQNRFRDKLVVLGISNEKVEDMQQAAMPRVQYYLGTDPSGQTFRSFRLQALPHTVLIDPAGIVRYEGHSRYLTFEYLEKMITRYSE